MANLVELLGYPSVTLILGRRFGESAFGYRALKSFEFLRGGVWLV
jgi:hypothetical protein